MIIADLLEEGRRHTVGCIIHVHIVFDSNTYP